MPSSLAEVAEKIAKGKTIADPEVDQLVTEYWQKASGWRVKDYRDLAEHHAIISSDVRIVPSVTGEPLLVLCLPNNPETKSARELRFRDPIVDAIPFVIATFVDLLALVSRVCDAMVAAAEHLRRHLPDAQITEAGSCKSPPKSSPQPKRRSAPRVASATRALICPSCHAPRNPVATAASAAAAPGSARSRGFAH